MHFTSFLNILAFAALSSQSPTSKHTREAATAGPLEPCQQVADYINSFPPNSTDVPLIPASLAYSCLTSIPFNATATISFIDGLKNFFQFQSTLAYAANPPPTTYEREPVDLMDGFDKISETAANGKYNNHYEFEADLRILLRKLHDGHINWQSSCLEGLFTFGHQFPIVSLADSPDGIPKIYGQNDFPLTAPISNCTKNYTTSAISKIDGIPVNKYLSDWIEREDGGFHDPDTRWNSLFARRHQGVLYPGAFAQSILYQGNNFTVTFENGTQKTVNLLARVVGDFANITSGPDLFSSYCLDTSNEDSSTPTTSTNETMTTEIPSTTTQSSSSTPTATQLVGYPSPYDISTDGAISTYILDDNTGVFVINTFEEDDAEGAVNRQAFLTKAISDFKSCDVEHVIIDVSSNDGGSIVLGLDTFKQFFPDVEPWGASNMRANPAAEVYYQVLAEEIESAANETELSQYAPAPFSYYYQRDAQNEYYPSWEEAYGPVESYNDSFTNLTRWDLVADYAFNWDFNVTNGDDIRNASYATPWQQENIIILGDGACSSTCTTFTEAMKEVGVRTFVYGGRPQQGPMQMIGGVEGSQVITFDTFITLTSVVLEKHPEKADEWNTFLPNILTFAPYPTDYSGASLNLKNSFRKSKSPDMNIPLEYIYDAADFRIQMTKEYFQDISTLWSDVSCRVWEE